MTPTDEITVASTTDTQEAINSAAGVEPEEETTEAAAEEKEQEGNTQEEEDSSVATEEEAETTSESETEEDEESEEAEEEKPVVKGKGKWSKRVDKLTAKLSAAQRRIAELEGKPSTEEETEEEESESVPDLNVRPKRDAYRTQEEYEDSLMDWKLAVRDAETARKSEETQRRSEFDNYLETQRTFREEHDDFQDVADEMIAQKITIPDAVQVAIIQSNRPDLAYHLAKNLDTVKEMNQATPSKAVLILGRVMAEIDGVPASGLKAPVKKAAATKVVTKPAATGTVTPIKKPPTATAPIKPVKSAATRTSVKPLDDPEVNFQEYKRRRATGETN